MLKSLMLSATGTQAINNKRSVEPVPQNMLEPISEKRASLLNESTASAAKNSLVSLVGFSLVSGLAMGKRGINVLATVAKK
jgi:hypothetical protein